MKTLERQKLLLAKANKNSFVSIPDTAQELQVSVETIRRDINILCNQKKLKKVHGGAVPIQNAIRKDPSFFQRFHHNPKGKSAVAAESAQLVRSGDVVTMDGGATTLMVAQHITGVSNVTFVVNSLPIASTLIEKISSGDISGNVIILGGKLTPANQTVSDAYALEQLEHFRFDIAFISASSVSAYGVSNFSLSGVFVRKLMDHAATRVLAIDSEKLGAASTYRFASISDFDYVVTDDLNPFPQDLWEQVESSKVHLTIVPNR